MNEVLESSFRSLEIQQRRNAARLQLLIWLKKHGGLDKEQRLELRRLKYHA
ncbi:hypothetical protein [Phyllobacterium myrsinacearum]|uniref:Uncharacterized protein n=1 Tax=Phyllobacterium myrsinacearum TaxID=28101 RepID=A0A839ESA9_9HYPH|nr:hypothetical protein [Phyllobacterium myrsinacearum]MBA8881692.1 hypothetical protein [Phyllobacterium myrsinacearum]